MTINSTADAIRAARDNSGAAHETAMELLDSIAHMGELSLRHDYLLKPTQPTARVTLQKVMVLAAQARAGVLAADSALWHMSDAFDGLEGVATEPGANPAGIPTVSQVRAEDFAEADAALVKVSEALAAFDRDHLKPANAAHDRGEITFADHQAVQDEFDKIVSEQGEAIDRLMLAPAPDVAALHRKMQVMLQHELFIGWNTMDRITKQLEADTARLAADNA